MSTDTALDLIYPLGFIINDKYVGICTDSPGKEYSESISLEDKHTNLLKAMTSAGLIFYFKLPFTVNHINKIGSD